MVQLEKTFVKKIDLTNETYRNINNLILPESSYFIALDRLLGHNFGCGYSNCIAMLTFCKCGGCRRKGVDHAQDGYAK